MPDVSQSIKTGSGLIAAASLFFSLTGCGIPIFPVPVIKFAPPNEMLTEKQEAPLVVAALAPGQGGQRGLALRSGRVLTVTPKKTDTELLASLPTTKLRREFSSAYIPAYTFRQIKAGARHYYNFTITPEFERATSLYLDGRGEESVAQIETILADEKNAPALLWQASYLKVNVLTMMGRPDEAERETVRLERLEIAAMGKNHTTRALRAEVKYWAGDIEGALEDAAQVIRAFGDWRYSGPFSTPPLDQVELARCTTAQVRAGIVLGMSLLSKGLHREALPWLELSNQTMNNVMATARHPINALYFQPPEEIIWGRGMSLAGLGTALLSIDPDSSRAAEVFDQAREYFDALGFRAGPVLIETFKAHALLSTGHLTRAEGQARAGIAQATKLGLIEYVWRLEALRGKALLGLQRFDEAEPALRRAQAVVDLMAGTLASDDAKVRFGVGKEGITHDLIRIDVRKGDLPRLFEDMERGRARSFIALLANRQVATERGGDFVRQIRTLDRNIQQERQRKNALSAEGKIDPERERQLLEQRMALVAELRQRDSDLADALAVSSVSLETARAALPERALMVYALPGSGSESLSLLFISRTEVKLHTLATSHGQLKTLLDQFHTTLTNSHTAAQLDVLERLGTALNLSTWPAASEVFFVPSGASHFIPWGALSIDFPVATLPTGGWIARSPLAVSGKTRAAIVGDPEFGGLLPPLPGAREEARTISAIYGAPALLGSAATEKSLRQSVGHGVDVLHLATHALFDPVYPMQSALIMSSGRQAVPLTAEQLFAQPLTARLVILSACETGMGQVISGDELLGLARSFYLGGASSVLSSLWPVDDEASRLFMEHFHRSSRSGNYGRAWLEARNTLRNKGYAPSAYGAFVLGGSVGRSH